jgi:UDP-N-acetylmuramoyl-tripeptide--D-alanyl-D-alanine ligase
MATPIPRNRAVFTLSDIAEATGGYVRAGTAERVTGVVTDSREDVKGALFVALEGERFDGHAFVDSVCSRGAAAVLVSRDAKVPDDVGVVRVTSTLDALGALARRHRRRWGGTVVAVSGSAGKTTTRSAITAVLEALHPNGTVHSAAGNLNNRVGVPMVLLCLKPEHQIAVVEIGTNQTGEVPRLMRTAEPNVSVLTLIALEHSAGLGGLDAIEEEEGAALSELSEEAIGVGNVDDARVARQLERSPAARRVGYGCAEHASYRLLSRASQGLAGNELIVERGVAGRRGTVALRSRLLGEPGALATLAAFAVAESLSSSAVDPELMSLALTRTSVGEDGRLVPVPLADGSVLIDDTYNANPASMRAALSSAAELARQRSARLVLVLGEMRELGAESSVEHRGLGQLAAQSGAALLVAVGGDAELVSSVARERGLDAVFAEDAARAVEPLVQRLRPKDVVLVKASRGIGAEHIVARLVELKGRQS